MKLTNKKLILSGSTIEEYSYEERAVSYDFTIPEHSRNHSKIEVIEHEETHASGTRLGQMKNDLKSLEAKLDALVDLYLNRDIERDIYLTKKDALMRQKLSLQAKLSSVRDERKNWVEPLQKWILDSKQAGFLASSTKYADIRDFVRSFGTNPALLDKTISISFCPPSIFARTRKLEFILSHHIAPKATDDFLLTPTEVSVCDPLAWLSELVGQRDYITRAVQDLDFLVAH